MQSGCIFLKFMRRPLQIILLSLLVHSAPAQEQYFYKGRNFGSEALYNPLSLLLNGSYDIIQLDGNSKEIFTFPYDDGARNVLKNLGSPFGPVKH